MSPQVVEFAVLFAVGISVCWIKYPQHCNNNERVGIRTVRRSQGLIAIAVVSSLVNGFLWWTMPRLSRRLLCGRGGSQTIPFVRGCSSGRPRAVRAICTPRPNQIGSVAPHPPRRADAAALDIAHHQSWSLVLSKPLNINQFSCEGTRSLKPRKN